MEIEPCPCGAPSEIWTDMDDRFCVVCSVRSCWVGPSNANREQAIAAWNRVAGDRWRPVPLPDDRRDVMVHVKPGRGATHWRRVTEPPEPPPIQTSGYVELIGNEPLTEGSDK